MKVRDQRIHGTKTVTRINENRSIITAGMYCPVFIRRAFDRPAAGRADTDDAMPLLMGPVDQLCRLRGNIVPLRVHDVFLHVVHFYRPECTQAHMQGHKADIDSHVPDLPQKFRREMQSGGGSRRGSLIFRVNSLIAVPVLQSVSDIRRKRHLSQTVQDFFENPLIFETDQAVAALRDLKNLSLQTSVPEDRPRPGTQLLTGSHQALPNILFQPLQQQDLDGSPGSFPQAQQPCGNDLGVIQDQGVPAFQIFENIPERAVRPLTCPAVQDQKSRRRPVLQRVLGDQLLGKIIIIVSGPVPDGDLPPCVYIRMIGHDYFL